MFSVHVAPFVLPGGDHGALAVAHTVTRERRLQTTVVEHTDHVASSDELFRAVFDSVPVGVTVVGPDARWLRVNFEACRMLGYDREELIGAAFQDFTHPDDHDGDRRGLAAAFATDAVVLDREKRYLRKDGSLVWVNARSEAVRDETGKTLYLVVHLQDISERRKAQAYRRESDRRLHAIIDESPALISVKGRDQRYELVNREFQDWCGLPLDRIVGQRAEQMATGPVFEGGSAKDQLVLDGAGPSQDEDTLSRDGRQRVYLTSRFPLLDDAGQINAVCCSSVDITDRRDEERARRESLQSSVQIHEALAQDRLVLQGQPILNLASMQIEQAELLIRMYLTVGSSELAPPGEFLPAAGTFTYLKRLKVDYLKIDLQFVRDLLKGDADRQVVQAIIGVAKQYGIKTIAEGVEDQATLEELQRMGADYAQGYWIGRPAPFHELWKLTAGQEQT